MLVWMKDVIIPILSIVMGSAGLWGYFQNRKKIKKEDSEKQVEDMASMKLLIMGFGYDVIVTRGMSYISRGWVTKDEYEDLVKLFYGPYKSLGGNGLAEQVMKQIDLLPFNNPDQYFELRHRRQEHKNDGWSSQGTSNNFRHAIEQPRL